MIIDGKEYYKDKYTFYGRNKENSFEIFVCDDIYAPILFRDISFKLFCHRLVNTFQDTLLLNTCIADYIDFKELKNDILKYDENLINHLLEYLDEDNEHITNIHPRNDGFIEVQIED